MEYWDLLRFLNFVPFAHQTTSQKLKMILVQCIAVGMNTESRLLDKSNHLSIKTAERVKIARILKVQEALSLHLGSFHFSL